MSSVTGTGGTATRPDTDEVTDHAARVGMAGKGVLYLVVGVISVRVALSGSGSGQGQTGAIRSLANEGTFGTVLLWVLAVGLTAYAIWRLIQTFGQPDGDSALERAGWRASYLIRATIYGGLALLTWSIVLGAGSNGGGGSGPQTVTGRVLALPGGSWIVGAVGAIVIGVGLYQGRKALDASFMADVGLRGAASRHRTAVERLGRLGHAARTVIYVMVGVFVIRASMTGDSRQARGLDGALQELASQTYGTVLLLVVALGLAAYGAFCLVVAPYLVDTDG